MASVLLLFLLMFLGLDLSSTASPPPPPPPRTSFLLDSAERPLVHFSLPDVHNTTTLLLSNDGSTLYVGAENAVLSLDISQSEDIQLKKMVEWSPTDHEINECQRKGKNPTVDCPNFVRVLQTLNSTHLYACGSYAYRPHDAHIDTESFSIVHYDGAKGRCPFNPFERNAAITSDGELFTATTSNFRGGEPQLSRFFSKDGRQDVSLESSSLLEEPVFVKSSIDQDESKLYFFFTEVGKEFKFTNKLQIPRVAQVCKDDVGGLRILQKKWTSFAKASLLCKPPSQLPFNNLQDVFTLQPPEGSDSSETLFYGVFTTQWSGVSESAVCAFKLEDIRRVFAGPYLSYNAQKWEQLVQNRGHLGTCGQGSAPDSVLEEVKKSFLTNGGVNPVENRPILLSDKHYSRVAVMRTRAANHKQYTMLFLLTESGFLHKVALLDQGPRVIEEIQVFTGPQTAKSIVLSSSKGVLYVGTSEGVTAVSVAKCNVYRSCSQCLLARDPLCGWSPTRKVCDGLRDTEETLLQNLENDDVATECQSKTRISVKEVILVNPNEAVRLPCVKPSNLATLTWTSSRYQNLPENLFIQAADGSLRFFPSTDTFGSYSCEAEEGGYREVVMSYDVKPMVSPRSQRPQVDKPLVSEEPFEDIMTPETVTTTTQPPEEPRVTEHEEDQEDEKAEEDEDDKDVELQTNLNEPTHSNTADSGLTEKTFLTSRMDTGTLVKSTPHAYKEKSYYTELVAVSILLVTCVSILILGSLLVWRQRKPALKLDPLVSSDNCGRTNKSMETSSLSSPDDLKEFP
ncbi:semaphorin-4B-like [Mugil cephalus]|uniref:semaphorin-4B-like n=1 Tax=Mugil cephalus TaxID=48193 RepID=UPI001FB5D24F|nr:semaphorin-4B-like [Mugil cephalus]